MLLLEKGSLMAHGHSEELTGGRRYREDELTSGWAAMVLEVEVSFWDYDKHRWMTKWRDATPADLPENQVV